jgi:hypothetical protein
MIDDRKTHPCEPQADAVRAVAEFLACAPHALRHEALEDEMLPAAT